MRLPGEVEFDILPTYEVTARGFVVRQEARKPGPVKKFTKSEIKALTDRLGGECRLHLKDWYDTRGIPYGGKVYVEEGES